MCVWHACACACVCVCVCVRCVLGGEGSWVFASTALVVVWTAMYLTRYSDYLTGFRESLFATVLMSHQSEKRQARSLQTVTGSHTVV